jgi:hypothetical protein
LKRSNSLSTAFPSSGKGADKSRKRYENQFVGRINKDGQLSGLLFDYKLINQVDGGDILLTEPGWQFVQLHNPVLERAQEDPTQKLSTDERQFLVEHISKHVSIEDFTFTTLLRIIAEGHNAPREIDSVLSEQLAYNGKETSESFRSSQRSGAISRMEDLGLIRRVRNGIHVLYEITDMGENYSSKINQ